MNLRFLGIIAVIIAALVGIFAITGGNDKNGSDGGNSNTNAEPSSNIVGKADSKVTLQEYGDFQCPACKGYYPIVKQIKEDYKDRIKFQFSHFPLTQIHPNAFIGARAAEAAGKQGKFFEMHDLLYEGQDTWSRSNSPVNIIEAYAKQLQLNLDQFRTDMNSSAVSDTINADVRQVQALGGNSTPTFVINGKKIDKNPTSVEEFKKLIDDALAANQ